ncbi:MAG: tetratricopeptide repeat protein [Thainema sp.]
MTGQDKTPKFDPNKVNIDIEGHGNSRNYGFGEFHGTANFGDRIESQRTVLVTEIDPILPRREPDRWVDRTQPQANLMERIQSDRVLLTEVVAAGGFGKSLLACWAYEVTQARFDYALWINFQKQPSFSTFGRWVHQEIGFLVPDESVPDEELITQTIHRLSERRCLLVMDQLEEIEQSADRPLFEAFLEQWQQRGRKSMILVTTRNRFVAEDSVRYVLPGFTPQEGAAFLQKQEISASEEVNLEQLSTLADGHPLLLNLAASWLNQTAAGQLKETDLSFFERLFENNLGDPEAKVEEIFQLLLQQLSETLQTALLEVSVYQNPFDVERAQAMQPQVAEADLELLEMQGFLLKRQDRWTLHPLMRQFVEKTLQERQLEVGAHQKAVEFFTDYLPLKPEQNDIEKFLDDYLAVFHHHCELDKYEAAYDAISECTKWFDLLGYYRIWADTYERLTTAWKNYPPKTLEKRRKFAAALGNLGLAYRLLSQYTRSIELQKQALEIEQELGDLHSQAVAFDNLGVAYVSLSQYDKAIELFEQAIKIHREVGDRRGEATNLGNLGIVYKELSEYARSVELHEQALEIVQEIGHAEGQAHNLCNLGQSYRLLDQYDKAIKLHEQALEIMEKIGHRKGQATNLGNLGSAYYSLGKCTKAIALHKQALEINQEIGYLTGKVANLGDLGFAYNSLGQHDKAIEMHQQTLEISQMIGDLDGQAVSLGSLGSTYHSLHQYDKAVNLHKQALEINRKIGDLHGQAANLCNLGLAYSSLGQHVKAIEFYGQSLKIAKRIDTPRGQAANLFNRALAYARIDELWAAKQDLEAAKAIYEELQLDHEVKDCERVIYNLNQTIVMQPRKMPTLLEKEDSRPDWWEKSLPNSSYSSKSNSRQGQIQWLPYIAIAIIVCVLIIILQR